MSRIKGLWSILRKSAKSLSTDKIPKQSASLAYCTLFSMGPMLLVIIFLTNIFWQQEAAEGIIVQQRTNLTGRDSARQIQQIIQNASIDGRTTFAAITGFVALVLAASAVFQEIQDTLNHIWHLQLKTNAGWLKVLLTRVLSFSIVVSLSFLLLVSLVLNALLEALMGRLQELFPGAAITLLYILNLVLTLGFTTILFGIIYKVLPDARIHWKDILPGAFFTAILFMLGKFGITLYITQTNIGSTYGAAGSIVVLLVWVYYSSIILYFGAEFTKFYTLAYGGPVYPNSYTVVVRSIEVQEYDKSIQEIQKIQQRDE